MLLSVKMQRNTNMDTVRREKVNCCSRFFYLLLLLASFMVVFPSADLSAAAGNPFLRRCQSGRGDGSPYGDKEKYEHSK